MKKTTTKTKKCKQCEELEKKMRNYFTGAQFEHIDELMKKSPEFFLSLGEAVSKLTIAIRTERDELKDAMDKSKN